MIEKAILVTVEFESMPRDASSKDAAQELEELSRSAGLSVMKSVQFRQKSANAPLLIGRGKAEELRALVLKEKAHTVVFDSDLSSTQQRNLEEALGAKTLDRTQLILDIFAQRARSMEGQLQVELAQLKYLLPRLSGKGIALSRLGGGVGTRGPGEQKLEVDRRRIREKITRLSRELKKLKDRRAQSIRKKKEKNLPLAALVGYTNAGKSTLFNKLTDASVVVKDQLFSTLDTTTRLLKLPGNQKAFLADTVGFIRNLPHHLIESFKATLEEAVHADILIHVIDASRADIRFLRRSVEKVLKELGASQNKTVLVFNKIDQVTEEARDTLIREYWKEGVPVSAKNGQGIQALLKRLTQSLPGVRLQRRIRVPKESLGLLGILYEEAQVLDRQDDEFGATLTVSVTEAVEKKFYSKLQKYFPSGA